MRLDKYLSEAGIGTRSEVKAYIKKGYISVNGAITYKPDQKVSLENDTVFFQNDKIELSEHEYYLLNKPAGYVSATKDNLYPTVLSLINSKRRDLFPVGRLDKDTEGLLLITNDGALSHMLLSPKRHVDKTYYAILDGAVTEKEIRSFASGLVIGDEDLNVAMPAILNVISAPSESFSTYYNEVIKSADDPESLCHVTVTIQEGKYHQVKRMFQTVGRNVLYLRRISFGKIKLPDGLKSGEYKILERSDIDNPSL